MDNGQYVFNNYPAVNLANNQSIRDVLYPPGPQSGISIPPLQALLGLGAMSGLLGAGGGGGAGGGYWWKPPETGYAGAPVGQPLSAMLDQQPPEFWNGVVDKQNLGLGRINFPGTGGGGGGYGL